MAATVAQAARKGSRLKASLELLREYPVYCGISNKYAEPDSTGYLEKLSGLFRLPGVPFPCYSQALSFSSARSEAGEVTQSDVRNGDLVLPPSPQSKKKLIYYALDVASLYPVLALGVTPTDCVLDMCAAPGGKTFALLQMLDVRKGKGALALNDISLIRIQRLQRVLNLCMGGGQKQSVRVTQRHGEEWAKIERNEYDRVLVDAPCSSDRHNVKSWVTKGVFHPFSKELHKLQCNLLRAAIHAVKSEGVIVYSTCTESTKENDDVVAAVRDSAGKAGVEVEVTPPGISEEFTALLSSNIHPMAHGTLLLPSKTLNIGPMYTSRMTITKK